MMIMQFVDCNICQSNHYFYLSFFKILDYFASIRLRRVGCQEVGKNYAEFENRNDLI